MCIDGLKLFHFLGPETEKARLPNFRCVQIRAKSPVWIIRVLESWKQNIGDMYDGEVPEWIRYMMRF